MLNSCDYVTFLDLQCDIHLLLWERDLSEGVHILQQNNSRGSLISSGENQFWEVHFTVTLPTLCMTVWGILDYQTPTKLSYFHSMKFTKTAN